MLRRCDEFRVELDRITRSDLTEIQVTVATDLRSFVQEARSVACCGVVRPRAWWSGAAIERSWRLLREVEESVLYLVDDAELNVRADDALAHAKLYGLSDDNPLVRDLNRRRNGQTALAADEAAYRATIKEVLHLAHLNADRDHQEARSLRNRIIVASLFIVAVSIGLLVLQWRLNQQPLLDAPNGWTSEPWALVGTVMILGGIGSLFTAVPVMAKIPANTSPFNLPTQQAILKVTFGFLTAAVGIMALSNVSFGDPATTLHDLTIPAYALLAIAFGA